MLNLVAFDAEDDAEILQNSYDAILHKDTLQIVTDKSEAETILKKITTVLPAPPQSTLSFQNLFKITLPNGQFYIAQCLLNYGFSASSKSGFSDHRYNFQIVGTASLAVDLGKTLMRPETKTDKVIGRFFGNDIDFEDTHVFNKKYYLVSDTKEAVVRHFDKNFANTIAKYDNILLIINKKWMIITFDTGFEEKHSGVVEEILSNCKFLST